MKPIDRCIRLLDEARTALIAAKHTLSAENDDVNATYHSPAGYIADAIAGTEEVCLCLKGRPKPEVRIVK